MRRSVDRVPSATVSHYWASLQQVFVLIRGSHGEELSRLVWKILTRFRVRGRVITLVTEAVAVCYSDRGSCQFCSWDVK